MPASALAEHRIPANASKVDTFPRSQSENCHCIELLQGELVLLLVKGITVVGSFFAFRSLIEERNAGSAFALGTVEVESLEMR